MLKTIYIKVGKKIRSAEAEIHGRVAYVTVISGGLPLKLEFTQWFNSEKEAREKKK